MAVHSSFCTGWVFSYDLDAAAQANRDEIAKLAEVGLGAALSRPCAWGMVAACCAVLCCAVLCCAVLCCADSVAQTAGTLAVCTNVHTASA